MIKSVVFDFGGVYFTAGTRIALKRFYEETDVPEEKIREVFTSFRKKEGWLYRKGMLSEKEFWQKAQQKLNIDSGQVPRIKKMWHSSYQPQPGMPQLVKSLKSKYRLVVFSGNIKERIEYLDNKYGMCDLFYDFIFSFDFGFNKEDKELYDILVQNVGCSPQECVCIDDSPRVLDIQRSLGMHTILFENAEQVSKELRNLGVKV